MGKETVTNWAVGINGTSIYFFWMVYHLENFNINNRLELEYVIAQSRSGQIRTIGSRWILLFEKLPNFPTCHQLYSVIKVILDFVSTMAFDNTQ
jgi:hypothetical protein